MQFFYKSTTCKTVNYKTEKSKSSNNQKYYGKRYYELALVGSSTRQVTFHMSNCHEIYLENWNFFTRAWYGKFRGTRPSHWNGENGKWINRKGTLKNAIWWNHAAAVRNQDKSIVTFTNLRASSFLRDTLERCNRRQNNEKIQKPKQNRKNKTKMESIHFKWKIPMTIFGLLMRFVATN